LLTYVSKAKAAYNSFPVLLPAVCRISYGACDNPSLKIVDYERVMTSVKDFFYIPVGALLKVMLQ